MVYCFKMFYMIFFTLGTKITGTRFTVVLCVPRTLRTLTYSICGACFVHVVEGLRLNNTTCCSKIKDWCLIKYYFKKFTSFYLKFSNYLKQKFHLYKLIINFQDPCSLL